MAYINYNATYIEIMEKEAESQVKPEGGRVTERQREGEAERHKEKERQREEDKTIKIPCQKRS